MNEPSRPRRIILASTSAGAGHNQAALAILAGLKAARPDLEAEFVDVLKFTGRLFRRTYVGPYELGVTKLPRIYGWAYNLLDKPHTPRRTASERMRLGREWLSLWRCRRWLLDQRPALVLATHYLVAPMIGRMLARGVEGLRLMVVVTDNEAHRFWYAENVERYFIPNDDCRGTLAAWGIPDERMTVAGIPVHPKWTAPLDRQKIYRDWGLPADRPVVILSGGTYFVVGPIEQIARGILDSSDACVVVLAGNNKGLLAALAKLPQAGTRLLPVPFTDKVHELAEVSSIMVTKPGGLMTSECMAKGVAMVLTEPVPGQEAANARLLVREGAAVVASTTDQIIAQVARLLNAPAELAALRANARRLHQPATETIVREILKSIYD